MSVDSSNDNGYSSSNHVAGGSDAHGPAAMLLVESLLHGLIAKSVLSVADAIEIVEIATDTKEDIALSLGESAQSLQASLGLLNAIASSLRPDLPPV